MIEVVKQEDQSSKRTIQQFGTEANAKRATGQKRRSAKKDRLFGRGFYFTPLAVRFFAIPISAQAHSSQFARRRNRERLFH